MEHEHDDFLIAEFNALRREIEQEARDLGEFLRYALLSSTAIWTLLLSQSRAHVSKIAYFLPFALSLLLFGETLSKRKHILKIGEYIGRIEKHFDLPSHLGWETQLSSKGRRHLDIIPRWENSAWLLLCGSNLVGAIWLALSSKQI